MALFRDVMKWFYPKRKFKPPLRTIISPYKLQQATEQERLLMLAGAARSPQDAQRLMERYDAQSAGEVIDCLPPRPRPTLRRRLVLLVRRFEGHDTRDILGSRHEGRITVRYRYKRGDRK